MSARGPLCGRHRTDGYPERRRADGRFVYRHPAKRLPHGSVSRQAGSDRFSTAAAVSAATFAPRVPVVYVATGHNFPDALAGGPASGMHGGPVLLVETYGIPAATARELQRLKPTRIVVAGGASAVS